MLLNAIKSNDINFDLVHLSGGLDGDVNDVVLLS